MTLSEEYTSVIPTMISRPTGLIPSYTTRLCMTGPDNELFAIVPVEGNQSPPEAIVVGDLREVTSYIGQSIARIEEEQRLAQAQQDAAETERIQSEARACAAQMLVDGLTHLSERLDEFETRKPARAEQARRAKEAAEYQAIEDAIAAHPDPDNPDASTVLKDAVPEPGGELHSHPAVDREKYDPEGEHTEDALTGLTPSELEKDTPPPLGDYGAPLPPKSPYRTPTTIGGN
jgi:hypothetical protein